MGAAVMRWFTIRSATTTSQSAKSAAASEREAQHHVRAGVGEQQHLVGGGRLRADDGGQRLVVDHDEVGGVGTDGAGPRR